MGAQRLMTMAVVSMLLIGGVAAIGAATPADNANEKATDTQDAEVPPQAADAAANAGPGMADAQNGWDMNGSQSREAGDEAAENGDRGATASADRGPPGNLPAPVPDHVREIHETIHLHLDGEIADLGEALSELHDERGADESDDVEQNDETDDTDVSDASDSA